MYSRVWPPTSIVPLSTSPGCMPQPREGPSGAGPPSSVPASSLVPSSVIGASSVTGGASSSPPVVVCGPGPGPASLPSSPSPGAPVALVVASVVAATEPPSSEQATVASTTPMRDRTERMCTRRDDTAVSWLRVRLSARPRAAMTFAMPNQETREIFAALGLSAPAESKGGLVVRDPSSGAVLATLPLDDADAAERKVAAAHRAFLALREVPGPKRGEIVRRLGEVLRGKKNDLARLLTAEVGKGIEEARGEVQEMIDICDFAVGLSRTLGGRTLLSEREGHRMFEQWHPLGPVLC